MARSPAVLRSRPLSTSPIARTNYGTFVFVFSTGSVLGVVQNFDTVTVPALPAGWVASQGVNGGGSPFWVTSNAGALPPVAFSLPNSVFTPDPASLLDNRLDTPVFTYGAGQTLKFQHNFGLEQQNATAAYDAGVLEISINGGAFTDIVTAGGSFVTGGYNHTSINTGFSAIRFCPAGRTGAAPPAASSPWR